MIPGSIYWSIYTYYNNLSYFKEKRSIINYNYYYYDMYNNGNNQE